MNTNRRLAIARTALERIEVLGMGEPARDHTAYMFGIAHDALCALDAIENPDLHTCDLCGRAALPDDIFCDYHRQVSLHTVSAHRRCS